MEKLLADMNEQEIREVISTRLNQYKKANERVDKFGTIKCISEAHKYLCKYSRALKVAYNKGFNLSEDEISTMKLMRGAF